MKHEQNDFQQEIDNLKENINDLKQLLINKVTSSADRIPEAYHKGEERIIQQVEENPMQSVGFAALIGFIFGVIFTSKIK
ncbi:MAG: hypothetical protein ABSF18_06875 [Gammaproteobacteria bacterium]|jgi:ElaB/YqjD/DUF883 family membrane-anchored ribosome-binding protein